MTVTLPGKQADLMEEAGSFSDLRGIGEGSCQPKRRGNTSPFLGSQALVEET